MASVSIVGAKSSHAVNAPPSEFLTHLQALIQDLSLGGKAIINGAGEALVPGPTQAWSPDTVADWINAGDVWVDWCGIPMYYNAAVNGAFTTLGVTGFQAFAEKAGYAWLNQETWRVVYGQGYPSARGYAAEGSQAGVWLPTGTFSLPGGAFGIGGGQFALSSGGYFALMALHAPGRGIYVYANYSNANQFLSLAPPVYATFWVPAQVIADFLSAVAAGASEAPGMTIAHAPYSVAVPKAPSGGGGSSPYTQSHQAQGIQAVNGYYVLEEAMSAQTVAAREGITLQALEAANPLQTYMKQHPGATLKVGTRLKVPGSSSGGGKSGGGSGGSSGSGGAPQSPGLTTTQVLEAAGVVAGSVGAGAAVYFGVRSLRRGRAG